MAGEKRWMKKWPSLVAMCPDPVLLNSVCFIITGSFLKPQMFGISPEWISGNLQQLGPGVGASLKFSMDYSDVKPGLSNPGSEALHLISLHLQTPAQGRHFDLHFIENEAKSQRR